MYFRGGYKPLLNVNDVKDEEQFIKLVLELSKRMKRFLLRTRKHSGKVSVVIFDVVGDLVLKLYMVLRILEFHSNVPL